MSTEILLNGAAMRSRAEAHDVLARTLGLPDYYGRNLDALWDLASTMEADVVLTGSDDLRASLGDYGERLIATLEEAAQANPRFKFKIQA